MPKWRQLTRGSLVLGLVRTHKAVHLLWLANYPSGTCAGRHLLQVTGGGFSSSSSMDTSQSSAATAPSSGAPHMQQENARGVETVLPYLVLRSGNAF